MTQLEKVIKEKLNEKAPTLETVCDISKLLKLDPKEYTTIKAIKEKLAEAPKPLEDEREEINGVIGELASSGNKELIDFSASLQHNASSIGLVVQKRHLTPFTDGKYKLESRDLGARTVVVGGERIPFDSDIRLAKQRSAFSLGTGFFYKTEEDRYYFITAAHVLFPPFLNLNLADIRFVRTFSVRYKDSKEGSKNTFNNFVSIPKDQVFRGKKAILEFEKDYYLSNFGDDWAIIEIIPEITTDEEEKKGKITYPANMGALTSADLQDFSTEAPEDIYGLGHGMGLPLKLSPCGKIISDIDNFYVCSIDFFSGNSGSPIFDAKTHKVLGILARGNIDFYLSADGGKAIPGVLADNATGEICQKISFLEKQLDLIKQEETITVKKKLNIQQEILPYYFLERLDGADYQLSVCFANENRKVMFPAYPKKTGQTTYIECFLSAKEYKGTEEINKKKYRIDGPPLSKLSYTDETIEIRVWDLETDVYHVAVLSFEEANKNNSLELEKAIYTSIYLPEAYFLENKPEVIGLSVGYFGDETTFVKSALTELEVDKVLVKGIKFEGHPNTDLDLMEEGIYGKQVKGIKNYKVLLKPERVLRN